MEVWFSPISLLLMGLILDGAIDMSVTIPMCVWIWWKVSISFRICFHHWVAELTNQPFSALKSMVPKSNKQRQVVTAGILFLIMSTLICLAVFGWPVCSFLGLIPLGFFCLCRHSDDVVLPTSIKMPESLLIRYSHPVLHIYWVLAPFKFEANPWIVFFSITSSALLYLPSIIFVAKGNSSSNEKDYVPTVLWIHLWEWKLLGYLNLWTTLLLSPLIFICCVIALAYTHECCSLTLKLKIASLLKGRSRL
eukprot:TRINITY_DN3070_c0_g1_i4.p1 TRINITY_DN3070_c0_g1~~TRINITY_DN3070_c0_g1_i4.p1  ORF type:complete len:250 (-),score=9.07 TRINITY_DN3070_c0_g1_i4:173-922(-)